MKQIIGFDRRLQLDWMDATVSLCRDDLQTGTVGEHLQQRLDQAVTGDVARRKTITVLMRIWAKVPAKDVSLRDEGLELAAQVEASDRLWLHWGMSLLAYPFFRDVAAIAGKLGRLQGTFSQAQVRRRMVENWGQRTTLQRAIQRLVRTFVDWGVLKDADARGTYVIAPSVRTENQALALWFLDCALHANGTDQVPLRDLAQLSYTFPFDLTPFVPDVRRSDRFEVTRQGLDLEMVAPAVSSRGGNQDVEV
jgi:hypothetical protein